MFSLFDPGYLVKLVFPAVLYSYLNQSHAQDSAHSGSPCFLLVLQEHRQSAPSTFLIIRPCPHVVYLSPCTSLSTIVNMPHLVVSRLLLTLHAAIYAVLAPRSISITPTSHHTTPLLPVRRIVADGMLFGWTLLPLALARNMAPAHIARSHHCTDPHHTHSIFELSRLFSTLSLSKVCLPLP
jgi:hypothetical protein